MPEKRKDSHGRILKTGESQRTNGSYMYRYTDTTGKKCCCYAPTLKELRDKEQSIQKDLLQGISTISNGATVAELVDSYLRQYGSAKINTSNSQDFMRSVVHRSDFGGRPARGVSQTDARAFIVHMKGDLHYADGTISNIYSLLRRTFNTAIQDGIVRKNPFSFRLDAVIPHAPGTRDALTGEQVDTFLAFIKASPYYRKLYDKTVILLETGLRVSEMCGLTMSDIDFEGRSLRVNKQMVYDKGGTYHILPPKTASSVRMVPLTNAAVEALHNTLAHRPSPEQEPVVDGYSDFVFLNRSGKPQIACEVARPMRGAVKMYNATHDTPLPHISPHVLRHTFITGLYRSGLDLKSIQLIAGHSNVQTTLSVYTHMQYDQVKAEFFRAKSGSATT